MGNESARRRRHTFTKYSSEYRCDGCGDRTVFLYRPSGVGKRGSRYRNRFDASPRRGARHPYLASQRAAQRRGSAVRSVACGEALVLLGRELVHEPPESGDSGDASLNGDDVAGSIGDNG